MNRAWFRSLVGLVIGLSTTAVEACSVCYGDPKSELTRGALAGVAVLGGVIVSVLCGVAGISVCWMVRARRLSAARFGQE